MTKNCQVRWKKLCPVRDLPNFGEVRRTITVANCYFQTKYTLTPSMTQLFDVIGIPCWPDWHFKNLIHWLQNQRKHDLQKSESRSMVVSLFTLLIRILLHTNNVLWKFWNEFVKIQGPKWSHLLDELKCSTKEKQVAPFSCTSKQTNIHASYRSG